MYGLDTRVMEEFGRKLFDFDWNLTYSDDIRRMNNGKLGYSFVFSDSLIAWIVFLRTLLNISYRLMLGVVNYFLESEGFWQISLT